MTAPPGFDLGAKLEAFVDLSRGIKKGIDRLNDKWTAKPEILTSRVVGTAVSAASGDLVFALGPEVGQAGPTQGHRWIVRQLVLGGSVFSSAPAGTAYILREGSQPPTVAPLYNVVDIITAALPQRAFYGRGEFLVDWPDKLWCLIHTPSASTEYVAALWIEDYELGFGLSLSGDSSKI